MKRAKSMTGWAVACALYGAGAALAHHSFAMFDRGKSVTLRGTVRAYSWRNPHVFVWVNVANGKGAADTWAVEFAAGPNVLLKSGWNKDTLKTGDKVTIDINPLRDGRMGGVLVKAVLADGRTLETQIQPAE